MVKYFFLLLLLVIPLNAQTSVNQKEEFERALKYYSSGELDSASAIFHNLSAEKRSEFSIPSALFIGKILLKKNLYQDASGLFDSLTIITKDSTLRRELSLNKALLEFKKRNYYESAQDLLELLRISSSGEYNVYGRNALDTLAVNYLSPMEVSVLIDLSSRSLKPFLTLLLGKTYQAENKWNEAKETYLKVIRQYPSSAEKSEAEDYFYQRKSIVRPSSAEPVIAVLLPEDGSDAVRSIKEGIKFAVHRFNASRNDKTGLIFFDMQQGRIEQIKDEILRMNTRCIIGPVYSDDVRAVLSSFRGIKIPIISPTATENDLTSLNEYFFQANPNFTYRAKAMAQYIFYVENKRRMAVLNSIESYSPLLGSTFSQEFRRLGGEVVINETFKSGSGQLENQVENINSVITDIEGIYIPLADKEDITTVADAFSKNNVSISFYGNQDWQLAKNLEAYPIFKNKLTITSDYFIDYSSEDYNSFDAEFKSLTGRPAERNVFYGYDITKYFLNQLSKINADPEVIAARMLNGNMVTGFHNNISFGGDRVNKYINILKYSEGIFRLVSKFRTGN